MSYGWLTESSLIPKPSKKLEIDQTTVLYNCLSKLLIFMNS